MTQGSTFAKNAGSTSNTVYLESLSSLRTSAAGVLITCEITTHYQSPARDLLVLAETGLSIISITHGSFKDRFHLYQALLIGWHLARNQDLPCLQRNLSR